MSDPSEEMQARMKLDISNMVSVPYTPGQAMPDWRQYATVELSDGSTVPLSVFGEPPADLPPEDWNEWYADRDEELVTANLGDI